ncbi:MAG: hypothetical protein ACUVYA_11130 [Planctomycetota bacterium]
MTPAIRAASAPVLAALLAGCHLDVVRYRLGAPIDREAYERLEVGRTTRAEAVSALGAPDKLEWKSGDDYLSYLYGDRLALSLRFQFPPFRSVFGYQHTFLRLSEASDDLDAAELVFDEDGVLRQKSLRVSGASESPAAAPRNWRLVAAAAAERSAILLGDGGFADYGDLFRPGWWTGAEIGYRPVPVAAFLVSGAYRRHDGDSVREGPDLVRAGALELYEVEVGFRFSIPVAVFLELGDFDQVKRTLFETDPRRFAPLRLAIRTATGAAFSSDVPVSVNGLPAGDLYERAVVFSSSAGAGLEYGWPWGAVFAGVTYRRTGGLRGGDSALGENGDPFEAILFGGGLSIAF